MPKEFIDHIKLKDEGNGTYLIENDWSGPPTKWHPQEIPLAVWFEYGTDGGAGGKHWIAPRGKAAGFSDVLAWPSAGPESGSPQAIYSKRADNEEGQTLFSKGHYVKGLEALEPMTNGWKVGLQKFARELEREGKQHG